MKNYIILLSLSLFLTTQLSNLYAQNPGAMSPTGTNPAVNPMTSAPTMPKPALAETKLPEIKTPEIKTTPTTPPTLPVVQPQNPPVVIPPAETKMPEAKPVEKKMETKKEEPVIPADVPVIPTLPEAPKPEKIETKKSAKESDLVLFKDEFNRADEALSRFFAYSQELIAKNPDYRDQILDPLGQLFGKMIAALEVISGEKFIDEEALKEELERQETLALQAQQKSETEEMENLSAEPETPVVIEPEAEVPVMKKEEKKKEPETKEEFRATRQVQEPSGRERLKPVGEVKTIAPEM